MIEFPYAIGEQLTAVDSTIPGNLRAREKFAIFEVVGRSAHVSVLRKTAWGGSETRLMCVGLPELIVATFPAPAVVVALRKDGFIPISVRAVKICHWCLADSCPLPDRALARVLAVIDAVFPARSHERRLVRDLHAMSLAIADADTFAGVW